MSGRGDFLLVIPTYREHLRLPPFLTELVRVLSKAEFTTEIIVVDDGSPELEKKRMFKAIQTGVYGQCRVAEPIQLPRNQGKGAAILTGWRAGKESQWVSFVDADGAISPDEILRLFRLTIEQCHGGETPCLFAARIRMLGRNIQRRFWRHLSGRIFATLVGNLLESHVYDTQCGFKIIPIQWFRKADSLLQEPGLCFDIELLLALEHVGAKIIEVPIDWEDKAGGNVSILKNGLAMVRRLWIIRGKTRKWPGKNKKSQIEF